MSQKIAMLKLLSLDSQDFKYIEFLEFRFKNCQRPPVPGQLTKGQIHPIVRAHKLSLREGGEDVAADFAALQIAKQDHRELVGLEP